MATTSKGGEAGTTRSFLIRLSGLSAIVGGVLILLARATQVALYGDAPLVEHASAPGFIAYVGLPGYLSGVFLLLGVVGLYTRQYDRRPALGLIAFLMAIFGISLSPSIVLIVLVVFAIYDYISVHKTKHMVALADNVMDQRLPVLLVIPKSLPYSFLRQERLKKQLEDKTEREAMFMGLGDIVFPGMLAVSSLVFLPQGVHTAVGLDGNLLVALSVLVGCVGGFTVLMRTVLKGDPQPGLPLLNGGAIIGYLVFYIAVFGTFSHFPLG